MPFTDPRENVENIAATIARESRKPVPLTAKGNANLFAVPDGYTLETDEQLNAMQPWPARAKGKVHHQTLDSFVQYVLAHRTAATSIWCIADYVAGTVKFVAVLNDHTRIRGDGDDVELPGWRDLRATFSPEHGVEWKRWTAHNLKRMSQAEFATFIDDNLADIAPAEEGLPSGTDMLAMATSIEISQDKRIRSAVRLQSGGVNIEYVDDDDDATVERMRIVERFRLGVAPFWRGTAYKLDARLRYRVGSGKLDLWYELVRPDKLVEDAINEMVEKLNTALGTQVYFGTPDA